MTHSNDTRENPNPSGLCLCGCGQRTPIAKRTHGHVGWVKGCPTKYIKGHNGAKSPVEYTVENRGYTTPCWVWQRHKSKDGYGKKQCPRRGYIAGAHIVYWERVNGPVPEGMELDHLCRVRDCCNPAHLEAVTRTENQRRSPHRKVNPEMATEIRTLREQGWTLVRLAERFHISIPVVSKICRHEMWVLS